MTEAVKATQINDGVELFGVSFMDDYFVICINGVKLIEHYWFTLFLANMTSQIINQEPLKYNYNEMPYHGKISY